MLTSQRYEFHRIRIRTPLRFTHRIRTPLRFTHRIRTPLRFTQTTNLPLTFIRKHHMQNGSQPEWCISSMIYSRDTPFWSGTLNIHPWKTLRGRDDQGRASEVRLFLGNMHCVCLRDGGQLIHLYVPPHWDRSRRPNLLSHPVTVYWQRANQSKD